MSDMLPYTDIAPDLHTHALYLSRHSKAVSRFPSYRTRKTTLTSSIDTCVLPFPSESEALLSVQENVIEYMDSAKNVLADSLESFFPTLRTKSIRINHLAIPCPFWRAARTSIRTLRHTPFKGPISNGPGRFLKNSNFNDVDSLCDIEVADYDDDEEDEEEITKNVPQEETPISTWNILHLVVRTGRVDVLRYLLNVPQVPGPENADDGYLGGVQQLLKGRKVIVNKASLCLCACYYNQPVCLDVIRSYQHYQAKVPTGDGVRRGSFLAPTNSPKKRLALLLTRAPVLHLSPETEFKLSSKPHFEPSNTDYSLLDLSAYIGNEECFCYLLQSTDIKHSVEEIAAVWSTVVTCIKSGCLSESCLLLAVTWVLERVSEADISVLDVSNESVYLDDFDDVKEEHKKESIISLTCTLSAVVAPTPDMMRYPNRYKNRKGVAGASTVLSTEATVIAGDSVRDDQDSSSPYQETVLHLSCRRGLPQLVRVMLQYGANPHVRDSTVRTSLTYTFEY